LTGAKNLVKTILLAITIGPKKRYGAGNAAVDQMLENSELALNSKIQYEFAGGIRKAPSVIHLHHS
jgi:hypothetical protein